MDRKAQAIFGAGCFWGVQSSFDSVKGVIGTTVGYAEGHTKDPTYREVCSDRTGHAEVVKIDFDPMTVSYRKLLQHLFEIHDPTTINRQGPDHGSQYRSLIMYFDEEQRMEADRLIEELEAKRAFTGKIVTEVVPAGEFYAAEEYHQKYNEKHGFIGCHI